MKLGLPILILSLFICPNLFAEVKKEPIKRQIVPAPIPLNTSIKKPSTDKKPKEEKKKTVKTDAVKLQKKEEIKKKPKIAIFKMKTETIKTKAIYKSGSEYDTATVGIGIGIPYGGFGISGEMSPIKNKYWHNVAIFAGFGENTEIHKFFYNAGLRYYILGHDYKWRPRISAFYGTNYGFNIALIDKNTTTENNMPTSYIRETAHGVNLAAGVQWMVDDKKQYGFDFDVVFLAYSTANSKADDYQKEGKITDANDFYPSRVKISFGFRVAF